MEPRRRVAKEAARLLYSGIIKEFKTAKEEAMRNLGVSIMPSNYEVADELDILADETEGGERQRLILNMRGDAIRVMTALRRFNPTLIGSVWRGTARRGSDIDITVFDLKPDEVVEKLTVSGYTIDKVEKIVASKVGMPIKSHHILVILKDGIQVEVVVRLPEEKEESERCDIYGDLKRGLSLLELEKLMKKDPYRKFVPRARTRKWK